MFIRALSLSTVILLAAGCGMLPWPGGDGDSPVELDQVAPRSTQLAERQMEVGLQAEFEGNRVLFQVDNNYAIDGLLVAPESFAVGSPDVIHYSRDEDVITRFTPRMVPHGASMAGEIVVLPVESLENFTLFFFSTQTQPQMWDCEITPRRTPTSETATQSVPIPVAP